MNKRLAIYVSQGHRLTETCITLKRWVIPFVNHIEWLGAVLDRKIACRLYTETIIAMAFGIFLRVYPFS